MGRKKINHLPKEILFVSNLLPKERIEIKQNIGACMVSIQPTIVHTRYYNFIVFLLLFHRVFADFPQLKFQVSILSFLLVTK
jgi:hypothetical protein